MSLAVPPGYAPLAEAGLRDWLAGVPGMADRLGGSPAGWRVVEVGDGNLNLVFLVDGPDGSVCVKQALPYLRLVGEGWPLGLQRAWFEQQNMRIVGPLVPDLVPTLLHYDPALYALVMTKLSPHIILRRGLVAGETYPSLAAHVAEYMAQSLYRTSDFAMPSRAKRSMTADFLANWELCGLTEQVVFTDPWCDAPSNRWTRPQLDGFALAARVDTAWKMAAARLKTRFLSAPEALLHGDLHTGSIMVTATETKIIDPEFAFVGPMGFDVGNVLGNLLLAWFAQDGHATPTAPRSTCQDWLMAALADVWTGFHDRFLALWRGDNAGDALPAALFADAAGTAALASEQQARMRAVFVDALGFAGAEMTRRILGIAHTIDLDHIPDPDRRALCEARCLTLARHLMVHAADIPDIATVQTLARQVRDGLSAVPPAIRPL